MLLKHSHFRQDTQGKQTELSYLRTKDGAEIDFVLCDDGTPTHLIECKQADNRPTSALIKFAGQFSSAQAIQLVRELRREEYRQPVSILQGASWLAELTA